MIPRAIRIVTVPHWAQRYETSGDWTVDESGTLSITVSDLGDPRMSILVAVHELVEALLCLDRGITAEAVDAFDFPWSEHDGIEEPGDDPAAPYHGEHAFASHVEWLLARVLGIDWAEYDAAFERLPARAVTGNGA